MGHNIFVSYKYKDTNVRSIPNVSPFTWGRDYVDLLERKLSKTSHFYYGEKGDDDLSDKNDEYIYNHLKDKIFPTTCTIVLISAGMKETGKLDKSQWIPWEIYYSIREIHRKNGTSHRNGILGVVIPDKNGSYSYAIENLSCCTSGCRCIHKNWMFTILKENMFNLKTANKQRCTNGDTVWYGESSYIPLVTWDYFIEHIDECVERVERIKDNVDDYALHLNVNT